MSRVSQKNNTKKKQNQKNIECRLSCNFQLDTQHAMADSADDILMIFACFSQTTGFDIYCKLSSKESIYNQSTGGLIVSECMLGKMVLNRDLRLFH